MNENVSTIYKSQSSGLLSVADVCATYDTLIALSNITIEVEERDIVAVVGANAAGKSTLISTISGLVKNTEGAIFFKGARVDKLPPHKRVELGIVHVPEGRKLFGTLTVQDNLELGAFNRLARPLLKQNLEKVFEIFPKLGERRRQLCGSMSGGEQQMCAIGRGLMSNPTLLMLDEPTLGLSPAMADEVSSTVQEINSHGVAILLVEQNVTQSLQLSRRAYVIENGHVVLGGTSRALLQSSDLQKKYLGL